ncbi:unnamed protein product, partial [Meganyctiphanes norvegica]
GPALQLGGGSSVISANSFWILLALVLRALDILERVYPVCAQGDISAICGCGIYYGRGLQGATVGEELCEAAGKPGPIFDPEETPSLSYINQAPEHMHIKSSCHGPN